MVLDIVKLLQYTINKEMKISHLDDCKAIVCKKEDVPANVMSKIAAQYDKKFLDDAQILLFVKGPIDKDKVKKIFNSSNRSFGDTANLMVIGDFKLLKMNDADEDLSISDDSDETPDSEIEKIVNEPTDDEVKQDDEVAEDNSDAIDDALESDIEVDDNSDDNSDDDSDDDSEENKDSDGDDSEDDEAEEDEESDDADEDDSDEDSDDEDLEESTSFRMKVAASKRLNEANDEDADSDEEETATVLPTRYVFLKITLKDLEDNTQEQ